MNQRLLGSLQVIFVVDSSPDASHIILEKNLPNQKFKSKLILLSKNFGSFSAIRIGLKEAQGEYFAVMAADLQDPVEVILRFFEELNSNNFDVVIGVRESREDPYLSKTMSKMFWFFYRKFIQSDMPKGGVDIFGCNLEFRNNLLKLNELNSSLIGLVFWMGYRRKFILYQRMQRQYGKSAWKFSKKVKYLSDSIYAFSDLPIRLLVYFGTIGLIFSVFFSLIVLFWRLGAETSVPGYATTVLLVSFFAGLNSFGLGIIGSYVWRAFENTKNRPSAIVMSTKEYR